MSRRAHHTRLLEALEASLLRGPAHAPAALRQAAARGEGAGPLGDFVRTVHQAPYQVTAEQVAGLAAQQPDDVLFEVTLAAAHGAARRRHEAALALLDAAWDEVDG